MWIIRKDNATGIGAMGVAAGPTAEEVQFTVRSVLFEDPSLSVDQHEDWIHAIRHNPKTLEDHLKITAAGNVLIRRTVHGSPSTRNFEIRRIGYSKNSHGHRSVAAAYPHLSGPNKVEVAIEASGLTEFETETPLTAFVGRVDGKRVLGYSYQRLGDTVVIDKAAVTYLPHSVPVVDAVCLSAVVLPAWVGLVEVERIEKDSIVLDALSFVSSLYLRNIFVNSWILGVGRAAVQIVRGLGASAFFTVAFKSEVRTLSTEFGIDMGSITVNASASAVLSSVKR